MLSEVAIPRLGRRQVIDTIESLIRLRESLHRDYSHTIGEWEYDLWRLRAPSFPFTPLHAGR